MDFLISIEQSALARILKSSFYLYPLINAAHILSVGTLVGSAITLDIRILRGSGSSDDPVNRILTRMGLLAIFGAIATGLLLFIPNAAEYPSNSAFLVKMSLLVLAVLNFFAFLRMQRHGYSLKIPAALSFVFWPAILVAGRFIGFV